MKTVGVGREHVIAVQGTHFSRRPFAINNRPGCYLPVRHDRKFAADQDANGVGGDVRGTA
jgi:hypothetical protein